MYDCIIIGAGPAGMGAAIYAVRYKLKTLVLGREMGGMIIDAHRVENYPGFKSKSGFELMQKLQDHAKGLGAEIQNSEVKKIETNQKGFKVIADQVYESKSIILATGTKKRKLNVPKEKEYAGKGVTYCYTCDAPMYKGKTVAVVGGGNASALATILLSEYAEKVYHIYRGEALRGEPINVEIIEKTENVEIIYNSSVIDLEGENMLEGIELSSGKWIKLDGLFIEIGTIPVNTIAKEMHVVLDSKGYIQVDNAMRTNIPGVFAAGDITNGSNEFRQMLTAVSEGGIAANSAYQFVIQRLK